MAFKRYLEIIEQVDSLEIKAKFTKIEVTNKADAENKIGNAEKEFKGKKFIARYHICRHEKNGKNKPCSIEILKEIKK